MGFHQPGYVPDTIFKRTKVEQDDGKFVWGPHSEAKLPYSAYGVLVFAVHSLQVLQQFFAEGAAEGGRVPKWWQSWVLHVQAVNILLRIRYTVRDVFLLEDTIIKWQKLFFQVPEFKKCWRPKHHWALHAAHDVWRWGPPRFLWCMMLEMKNAQFKKGCKRSNFHNPAKATALFWVEASAYALQKKRKRSSCCDSSDAKIFGTANNSQQIAELLANCEMFDLKQMQILSHVRANGVYISPCSFVATTTATGSSALSLWYVVHVIRCMSTATSPERHLLLLSARGSLQQENGLLFAPLQAADSVTQLSFRIISVDTCSSSNLMALWHYTDEVAEKMHFVVRW